MGDSAAASFFSKSTRSLAGSKFKVHSTTQITVLVVHTIQAAGCTTHAKMTLFQIERFFVRIAEQTDRQTDE